MNEKEILRLPLIKLLTTLSTSEQGLTTAQVRERHAQYGFNENVQGGMKPIYKIVFNQLNNPFIWLLIIAALIGFFIGNHHESAVIIAVIVMDIGLSFFQEYRAEQALALLNKYVRIKTNVIRQNTLQEIEARELVPGDIVNLYLGDIVPADIRLLSAIRLTTNEVVLSGESMPVEKKVIAEAIDEGQKAPHVTGMLYMGTSIASGSAVGVVVATGLDAYWNHIARYVKGSEIHGNFHKDMQRFGFFVARIAIGLAIFIFVVNSFSDKSIAELALFSLALIVGITPELLPLITTITLAHGAVIMARKKVIVKRLASIESLGNMTILCCDKTGTLTEGILKLTDIKTYGVSTEQVLLYGLICSEPIDNERKLFRNSIDQALWQAERTQLLLEKIKQYNIITFNEFDFARRRMSCIVQTKDNYLLLMKGAPDSVVDLCTAIATEQGEKQLNTQEREQLKKEIEEQESTGTRLIAIAMKKALSPKEEEKDCTLLGVFSFLDTPKKTVSSSLAQLEKLDVAVRVMSGDSALVTRKICQDVGLSIVDDQVITGDMLDNMDDATFAETVSHYNVFARVTPEHKYRMIKLLQEQKEVVGFLGDGINDVPALMNADVGISVDTAVEVAKDAADVVLGNKSLLILSEGIMLGRSAFANVIKYILNAMSSNFDAMMTIALSSLFLPFIPMLPVQVLWQGFLCDIPLIGLSYDRVDPETTKKPATWRTHFIGRFMVYFGLVGVVIDLNFMIIMYLYSIEPAVFRTAWFLESTIAGLLIIFSLRTRGPFYKSRPSTLLIILSLLMMAAAVFLAYSPVGTYLFAFTPIPNKLLAYSITFVVIYFILLEGAKYLFYKHVEHGYKNDFRAS